MTHSIRRLWSLVPLAVAACGGGGGGGSGAISFAGVSATVAPTPAPAPSPAPAPVPAPAPAPAPAAFTPATGALKVVELATDLVNPWSLAFLPDGRMLITQREGTVLREGQLRLRKADGSAESGNDLISGVPQVEVTGQGGLLDVALDPAFGSNRRIYMSFSESDATNSSLNGTSVARAELDLANRKLNNLPGRNYGWPVISWGQEYVTNVQIGEGTAKAGMEQPLTYWETGDGSPYTGGNKSSIAPSGMTFYTSARLAGWQGNLFLGALAGQALWRLTLNGNTVVARERMLADRNERIRDVRQGPDGWLYLLTDGNPGKLLRLERAPS